MKHLFFNLLLAVFFTGSATAAFGGEVPRFKKVVWVWMENTSFQSMMGQKYIRNLWLNYPAVRFTHMKHISPITQANAVAMISGNDYGIRDNEMVRVFTPTIVNLLESKGITWKAYAEQYPGSCYLNEGIGDYKRYRVPFLSISEIQSDRQLCSKIVNFKFLEQDLLFNTLPEFSIVIPSLRGSGATSGVSVAQNTIQSVIDPILGNSDMLADTTVILSTTTNNDNKNPELFTMILGRGVKDFALNVDAPLNHYHLLRTIELGFDLGHLNQNDATAAPLTGFWK